MGTETRRTSSTPQSGSRSWRRVAIRTAVALCTLWAVLRISGLHHRVDLRPWRDLWHHPSEITWSDLGFYSSQSTHRYVSFGLESPVAESLRSDARCEPGYVFLAPGEHAPMILDGQGELVWMAQSTVPTQNFRVQRYRGQDYLTYWAGEPFGRGYYYMLDSSYNERYVVSPVGDIYGHPHDFTITAQDTALITAHDKRRADLSSVGGPKDGWIFDGVFQEIDIASGKLIFEWRASEHVPISQSYKKFDAGEGTKHHPFDYFHINNVDQDSAGNYIISAGHTHAVSCIERVSGRVLWNLGGRSNSFRDLGEHPMVEFNWPHEARWHGNDTVTVLDTEGELGEHHHGHVPRPTRGMRLYVDPAKGEAMVSQIYEHPEGMATKFEGNMQLLEDSDNVFMSWGGRAGYSEFTADGTLLCHVQFGASPFFQSGRGGPSHMSKGSWVGRPLTKPVARAVKDKIYVHWNGATEVVEWQLQVQLHRTTSDEGSGDNLDFHGISRYEKTGFETATKIPFVDRATKFRIAALDREGNELAHTDIVELGVLWADTGLSHSQLCTLMGMCLIGGMMTVWSTLHLREKYRRDETTKEGDKACIA